MKVNFHLGTHLKCARTVTFTLLLLLILNGFQMLNIAVKLFILDVCGGYGNASAYGFSFKKF